MWGGRALKKKRLKKREAVLGGEGVGLMDRGLKIEVGRLEGREVWWIMGLGGWGGIEV